MRTFTVIAFLLGLAGSALAQTAPTANRLSLDGKGTSMGDGAVTPRQGGDTIAGATLIPGLPYTDSGATCGYINDYDEVCPYTGSTSPDVVYSYTPTSNICQTIDLCASSYDTKLYVYAGGAGNLVACNDDAGCGYSGFQSRVEVEMTAGVTYFIVIDGYGGACGSYVLNLVEYIPCMVWCPPGGVMENEPPCGTDYVDHYNGGCNSSPNVFQPLLAADDGCAYLCGKSGTFSYQGLSYRDTDWFEVIALGGTITTDCIAGFPLQYLFIYLPDCNNLGYDLVTGNACQLVTLSHDLPEGAVAWLWVGPQVFTGVPCDGSGGPCSGGTEEYVLHACGIVSAPPVPARRTSWGGIKSGYR